MSKENVEANLNLTDDTLGMSEEDINAFMGLDVESHEGENEANDAKDSNEENVSKQETETKTGTDVASNENDAGVEGAEDELTQLRKQNELLKQRLSEASQTTLEVKQGKTETIENNVTDETLFGDWKVDDVLASEENFKSFLGDFAKKIISHTEERLLRQLPGTVSKMTAEQMETREIVTQFYAEHPQLAEVKPFVAKIVSTVASEHADWELHQVLAESADRAYKALGLKKQVAEQEKMVGKKPAFASPARGNRGVSDNAGKSKLERELEELMDLD